MVENRKKKKPLISICISTFNRRDKVYNLVGDILKYKGDEIEVIIIDNSSTDDTASWLSKINDHRFIFVKNDENIGSLLNGVNALKLASGKFAFICLDKDRIDHNKINDLIIRLNNDADVSMGVCSLNLLQEASDIIYEKGPESILNIAYLSIHPSGVFYDLEIFKSLTMLENITDQQKSFAFYVDLINAKMMMLGKFKQINLPIFYTETKKESKNVRSFTYTAKDAFFLPGKKIVEFDMFIESVQQLGLPNTDLRKMISKLYKRGLTSSMFGYKSIMSDTALCNHYGMDTHNVGFIELIKIDLAFSRHFLKQKLSINFLAKINTLLQVHVQLLMKLMSR